MFPIVSVVIGTSLQHPECHPRDLKKHLFLLDVFAIIMHKGNAAVTKERKKNVSLLQLIFPAEIAESLWGGDTIEAKTHPDVTMLFSDIVGFTSICSRATPIMVINMLESLYRDFDEFCGFFDVYKVETIGDAYCVASGLHRASHYATSQSILGTCLFAHKNNFACGIVQRDVRNEKPIAS
uniref:Uncharacterized protein n=1 Tax=Phlebotomus papatasi TaxID=29031 RepID=A0A1B0DMB9_PHLPP